MKSSNINHLQKSFEVGDISRGKVREISGLIVQMKKLGRPTYLNEHKD